MFPSNNGDVLNLKRIGAIQSIYSCFFSLFGAKQSERFVLQYFGTKVIWTMQVQ